MTSGFEIITRLDRDAAAIFFDFDGTLAPIVAHPSDAAIPTDTLAHLARLDELAKGALAIISGRDIATIDAFLAPHTFTVSGVHGYETRRGDGAIERLDVDNAALSAVAESLDELARTHTGLLVERKPGSVALHYRARPELAELCRTHVDALVPEGSQLKLLSGKMVLEVKAHAGDKGRAIATLMDKPPFASRRPLFLGDDVTDEAGFAYVNDHGGVSIKIGDGETVATHRLKSQEAVGMWLARLVDHLEHTQPLEGTAP